MNQRLFCPWYCFTFMCHYMMVTVYTKPSLRGSEFQKGSFSVEGSLLVCDRVIVDIIWLWVISKLDRSWKIILSVELFLYFCVYVIVKVIKLHQSVVETVNFKMVYFSMETFYYFCVIDHRIVLVHSSLLRKSAWHKCVLCPCGRMFYILSKRLRQIFAGVHNSAHRRVHIKTAHAFG